MNYTPVVQPLPAAEPVRTIEAHSLYQHLQAVTDPRKKRGVRYAVALMLTLIILAKLAGETTLSGTAQWVRLRSTWLTEQLQLPRRTFPCAATYSNVLKRLDAAEVTRLIDECLTRQASPRNQEEGTTVGTLAAHQQQTQHVALDGKTLRGTRDPWQEEPTALHLLALYEVGTGLVLAQAPVEQDKENEIVVAPLLVSAETVRGRVVTADAMHTRRAFSRQLHALGADYLWIAKDNQRHLHEDIALFFTDPDADRRHWQTATTCEKGHGRLERRTITSTELSDYFHREWEGIAQVFQVARTTTVVKQGEPHTHYAYGLTSLSPQHADATTLNQLVRAHWAIDTNPRSERQLSLRLEAPEEPKRNGTSVRGLV